MKQKYLLYYIRTVSNNAELVSKGKKCKLNSNFNNKLYYFRNVS